MTENLKVYKRYENARKAARPNGVVITVGNLHIVGDISNLTEISIADMTEGYVTGHVNVGHLRSLGNANWATPHKAGER